MNKDAYREIERDLELLRQELLEPFNMSTSLDHFFDHPVAKRFITGGEELALRLISFLKMCHEPALVRVAVILLSRFSPSLFYEELRRLLERADERETLAFEPGLWMTQLEERRIAEDLVQTVTSSGNPYPLLLIQRPVAKTVRVQLAEIIKQHRLPHSLYALYCYRYAMSSADVSLLTEVSRWAEPEMAGSAGLYLLKLGSKEGLPGIKTALEAVDEKVRSTTYYELKEFLPQEVLTEAHYDPRKKPELQVLATKKLVRELAVER